MTNLPNGYQEVEYIQSSGTQLIDTGYLITPNTEVSVDYQFINANNQDFIFGIGSDSNTSNGITFCVYIGIQGGIYRFKPGLSDGTNSDTWNNSGLQKNTNRHTFVMNNGNLSVYDTSGTLEDSTNTVDTITRTAGHSFGLFCWWRTDLGPSRQNITAAKLYGCTIKEGGTLQRNFVPCYRKSDNVIGLYDTVNEVFYTNAGTGTFTKGPDVLPPKKYIDRYYLNGEVYGIRFATPSRTFTVTFTETSDPTQFNPVYSDDATGLTPGDSAFDEFFGYSAVRLSTAGVETAEVTQADSGGAGKLDITQLGTLTSGDNVMIKFPVRGVKMTKNGSTITLSITDAIGKESDGYQYYAFQKTGDIEANASTTVATYPLYLGTYQSYTDGSTLKSWSGKTPQGNYTMGNAISYAGNNGTGYTISGWYQRQLINAYYMMKYGNPDSQSVIGRGFVDGNSAAATTGGTDSQTNATYGESTGKYSVKLFGLEDWRGNQSQRVGGMFTDGSKNMRVALHDFTASISTSESQYKNAGAMSHSSGSYYDISSILGTNKGMFAPNATVNNSSYNTYWCDSGYVNASRLASAGGDWTYGSAAGAFRLAVNHSASTAAASIGARLMFL